MTHNPRPVITPQVDPWDIETRSRLGDLLHKEESAHALGTKERGRELLLMMAITWPTPALTDAYLENLRALLRVRASRRDPGRVVLGLGPGRCGSTSLTALLATAPESCCTHENPPAVHWVPAREQVELHWQRFHELTSRFALAFDAAHWWLNLCDEFFARFPTGRAIGLCRNEEACVRSFASIKGTGRGSINHWAPPHNGIWQTAPWDPTYPSFPLPAGAADDPDRARQIAIAEYVRDYNARMRALADRYPDRVLLVATEDLDDPIVQRQVGEFAGVPAVGGAYRLNVGTVEDGKTAYRF